MRNILSILITVVFMNAAIAQEGPEGTVLILGATAHLGTGDVVENSAIGVKNGKIVLMGLASQRNIIKSEYKQIIDATGKHVYPGFISTNTFTGIAEIETVRGSNDFKEVGSINPNVRSLVAYNTDSKVTPTIRTNGVLVAQSVPRGGLISGTSSVFKLDGWNWEDAVYRTDDGIHLNWPAYMSRTYVEGVGLKKEKNKNHDNHVAYLRDFFMNAKAYCENPGPDEKNLRFESMRGVLNGTKTVYFHADNIKEILEGIDFLVSLSIKNIVLMGGTDAMLAADVLIKNNIPVALGRIHSLPPVADSNVDYWYALPAELTKKGVTVCLTYEGDMEVMGSRNLPFLAGTAAAYGLTREEALKLVTLNAAKVLGIDKTCGSLEVGKDAMLFISTGDALDMRTNNVEAAWINGKQIDLNNDQKELYEKYRAKYGVK